MLLIIAATFIESLISTVIQALSFNSIQFDGTFHADLQLRMDNLS